MTTLINQIKLWAAAELKYWEQAALDTVLSGRTVSREDLQQLTIYFLQDSGLATIPSQRPRLAFATNPTAAAPIPATKLARLFDLQNVNALPPGQEIRF